MHGTMFDAPPTDPLAGSVNWLTGTLIGDLAATVCILAIAFVGFSMLTGRIAMRRGLQVILGCFVLLGAPVIATSMLGVMVPSNSARIPPAETVVYEARPREQLAPVPEGQ